MEELEKEILVIPASDENLSNPATSTAKRIAFVKQVM
jgi:hypothetical protein